LTRPVKNDFTIIQIISKWLNISNRFPVKTGILDNSPDYLYSSAKSYCEEKSKFEVEKI